MEKTIPHKVRLRDWPLIVVVIVGLLIWTTITDTFGVTE